MNNKKIDDLIKQIDDQKAIRDRGEKTLKTNELVTKLDFVSPSDEESFQSRINTHLFVGRKYSTLKTTSKWTIGLLAIMVIGLWGSEGNLYVFNVKEGLGIENAWSFALVFVAVSTAMAYRLKSHMLKDLVARTPAKWSIYKLFKLVMTASILITVLGFGYLYFDLSQQRNEVKAAKKTAVNSPAFAMSLDELESPATTEINTGDESSSRRKQISFFILAQLAFCILLITAFLEAQLYLIWTSNTRDKKILTMEEVMAKNRKDLPSLKIFFDELQAQIVALDNLNTDKQTLENS